MENAVLLAELHKLLILFCYIKKSVREHNQLASCLIYARALPAHPYNMYLLIVLSVRSIIESVITGRGNPYKLFVNHCRINARKNFFCERVIKVWNSLPPSMVNFESLSSFRNSLNNVNLRIYTQRTKCFYCVVLYSVLFGRPSYFLPAFVFILLLLILMFVLYGMLVALVALCHLLINSKQ